MRQVGNGNVAGRRGQAVAQACSVDKERYVVALAGGIYVGKLLLAVDGAYLGREREIHHARLHHVLWAVLVNVVENGLLNLLCGDYSLMVRQSQYLVPSVLNGSSFMHIDVPSVGADNTLIRAQQRSDDSGIGLSATH